MVRSEVFALFALMLLQAGPGWATYRADFTRAVAALADGAWRDAELLTESAIAKERFAREGVIETESFGPLAYTPHLVLGISLYEQGDCAAALRSLEFARAQQVAERTDSPLLERGERARAVCLAGDRSVARGLLSSALDRGNQELERWRRLEEVSLVREKLAERPDVIERTERAARTLRLAAETLRNSDSPEGELNDATRVVESAIEELVGSSDQLRTIVRVTLAGRVAQVGADLGSTEELAARLSAQTDSLTRDDANELRRSLRELERAGEDLTAAAASGSLARVDAAAEKMTATGAALRGIEARFQQAVAERKTAQEAGLLTQELRLLQQRRRQLGSFRPSASAAASRLATVDRRLEQIASDLEAAADGPSLAAARVRLEEAAVDLAAAEEGAVDGGLAEAADAYLQGRYAQSIRLIEEYGSCGRESAGSNGLRRCVLEAASSFALLRRGADQDEARARRVQELVSLIKSLDPGYRPSPSVFSPAFRALFSDGE